MDLTEFKKVVKGVVGSKAVSILIFGSAKGVHTPQLSDIDVLILCKKKEDIPIILAALWKLE